MLLESCNRVNDKKTFCRIQKQYAPTYKSSSKHAELCEIMPVNVPTYLNAIMLNKMTDRCPSTKLSGFIYSHDQFIKHMDLTMTSRIHTYTTGVLRNSLVRTISITRVSIQVGAYLSSPFLTKRSINGH